MSAHFCRELSFLHALPISFELIGDLSLSTLAKTRFDVAAAIERGTRDHVVGLAPVGVE